MNIAIYGAQGIALGVYKALKELHQEINVLGFIVTEIENNPSNLDGILVYKLSDFASEMTLEEKENVLVLIATPENAMEEIEENLDLVKMRNHVRIDAVRWAKMQELRFTKNGEFNSINTYPVGSKMPLLNIYKVIHHKDKSLQMNFSNPNYMTSLQVGAANTDIRVGELTDDLNDNISLKNGNYSELKSGEKLEINTADNKQAGSLYQFHRNYNFNVAKPNTWFNQFGEGTPESGTGAEFDGTPFQKATDDTYGDADAINRDQNKYSSSDVYMAADGTWRYIFDHVRVPILHVKY